MLRFAVTKDRTARLILTLVLQSSFMSYFQVFPTLLVCFSIKFDQISFITSEQLPVASDVFQFRCSNARTSFMSFIQLCRCYLLVALINKNCLYTRYTQKEKIVVWFCNNAARISFVFTVSVRSWMKCYVYSDSSRYAVK